jgi:hypothetical protein
VLVSNAYIFVKLPLRPTAPAAAACHITCKAANHIANKQDGERLIQLLAAAAAAAVLTDCRTFSGIHTAGKTQLGGVQLTAQQQQQQQAQHSQVTMQSEVQRDIGSSI